MLLQNLRNPTILRHIKDGASFPSAKKPQHTEPIKDGRAILEKST
jgi:hypothetical protein